jgi:hypothetical protein
MDWAPQSAAGKYRIHVVVDNLSSAPSASYKYEGWSGYFTLSSGSATQIQVTSPQASEVWRIGSTYTIRWQNSDAPPAARYVQLYTNPVGSTAVCLIANSVLDTGSYMWTIPTTLDRNCWGSHTLSVLRLDGSNIKGQSSAFTIGSTVGSMFKISEISPFATSYPAGGNVVFKVRGIEPDGTWTAADEGFSASGQVYTDTGPYEPVPSSINSAYDPATGWWTATVPAPTTAGTYKMRVVIWCGFDTGKVCSDRYGAGGPQVEQMVPFLVDTRPVPKPTIKYIFGTRSTDVERSSEFKVEVSNPNNSSLTYSMSLGADTPVQVNTDGHFYKFFTAPGSYKASFKVVDATGAGDMQTIDVVVRGQYDCATVESIKRAPLKTTEFGTLNSALHPEILNYRIQWYSGAWSEWYTPGVNDLDWKTNPDGTYRLAWAYFGDHNHEYQKCTGPASTQLKVISPNGGEKFADPLSLEIKWKVSEYTHDRVYFYMLDQDATGKWSPGVNTLNRLGGSLPSTGVWGPTHYTAGVFAGVHKIRASNNPNEVKGHCLDDRADPNYDCPSSLVPQVYIADDSDATFTVGTIITAPSPVATLNDITTEAQAVATDQVEGLKTFDQTQATTLLRRAEEIIKKISSLQAELASITPQLKDFIALGTPTTDKLGLGERAGVVSSFTSAFDKTPTSEADWSDVIKIANGRWPTQRSTTSEAEATQLFKSIYHRAPNRSDKHDDAAVTVMAYGLRPANRNLGSEAAAIKSFRATFGKDPETAADWDAVRAIAYSGAHQ